MSDLLRTSGSSRRRSVGDSTKDRRPRLKALAAASAQERRRHEFIANQKQASKQRSDDQKRMSVHSHGVEIYVCYG